MDTFSNDDDGDDNNDDDEDGHDLNYILQMKLKLKQFLLNKREI